MLYTLAAIKAVFFSDAVFELSSCKLVEDETKIRTRYSPRDGFGSRTTKLFQSPLSC